MRSLNKIIMLMCVLAIPIVTFGQSSNFKAPREADTLHNPFTVNQTFIKLGGKTYKTDCTSCHGKSGKGNGPAAVALNPRPANLKADYVQKSTEGALFWKISHGKGSMPAWGKSLKPKQIWALVTYIKKDM